MTLTTEAVLALAPDGASAKSARELVVPSKWPVLGANDAAAWGECQGSGAKPYQTQVDFSGPAFRCSCPSRKFPCKHGLALLLLRTQNASAFASTDAPAWVSEWLASRSDKAQKKEEKQASRAAAPVDPHVTERRDAQRWQRIEGAAQELHRWLADQLARGLGVLGEEVLQTWHTMARRMVDAQAPGLGQRVRDAAEGVRRAADWPERTLERLGLLQLACDALARRAQLPPDVQADLRVVAGWPHDRTEVLAQGERVTDRWCVLGSITEDRDDRLVERRVWLHGERSGRRAWLLDHAFGGRGFEHAWLAGASAETTLAFFPGASALRAVPVDAPGTPCRAQWPDRTHEDEWLEVAKRIAACPWVNLHPLILRHVVPVRTGDRMELASHQHAVALAIGDADAWTLLAASGGRPLHVMGEWDGRRLAPLSAWSDSTGPAAWMRGGHERAGQYPCANREVLRAHGGPMSTAAWAPLLPAAMVGTERHGASLPSLPGEIGVLASHAAASTDEPATALLRVAAVLATCALAGGRGAARNVPLPTAAAEDTLPALEPGPVHDAVRWAVDHGTSRLHHGVCMALAAARRRLPTTLLPQALELGRRSLTLRTALPVLGERGLWLAAQRDEWKFAAGTVVPENDAAQWTDGTIEQRRAFLARERGADPAAARQRLQGALPELAAKERAELVMALATGLGPDDEALLDALRADRSRDVRQAALALLLHLPAAAHPRRAAARVAALMAQQERGLLRKRWQIDAPLAASDDWKADQVEAVRPQHEPLGERAWWLYQLVRQVPLHWWGEHTALSPADLLEWAAGTNWSESLLRGWRDVLFAAPDEVWCDALLDRWPKALRENPSSVLALLSPARRERHLQSQLRDNGTPLHVVVAQILAACPAGQTLSPDTSRLLVERVVERAGQLNEDHALRAQLGELACALHSDTLDRLVALPRRTDETPSCAEALQTTTQVVATRRALLTLIPTRTP